MLRLSSGLKYHTQVKNNSKKKLSLEQISGLNALHFFMRINFCLYV